MARRLRPGHRWASLHVLDDMTSDTGLHWDRRAGSPELPHPASVRASRWSLPPKPDPDPQSRGRGCPLGSGAGGPPAFSGVCGSPMQEHSVFGNQANWVLPRRPAPLALISRELTRRHLQDRGQFYKLQMFLWWPLRPPPPGRSLSAAGHPRCLPITPAESRRGRPPPRSQPAEPWVSPRAGLGPTCREHGLGMKRLSPAEGTGQAGSQGCSRQPSRQMGPRLQGH